MAHDSGSADRRRVSGRARLILLCALLCVALAGAMVIGLGSMWPEDASPESSDPPTARSADEELRGFLTPWYEALKNNPEQPARVVVVGDSISEGVGMPSPVHQNRFVGMLQESLRQRLGSSGAAGYVPAFYADVLTVDDNRRSGAPAQEYLYEKWGLGGRALLMPATSTITYQPLPARRVRVWFGALDFLGGEAVVRIDGVEVTAQGHLQDGRGASDTISSAASEPRAGLWWESADLGAGEHVVEITSVTADKAFVHTGVEFLDPDAESGIHIYDGSHSGAAAQYYVSDAMLAGHWAEVSELDPQLVIINLGSNPEGDYRASLERLVEVALQTAPRAQILVIDGYEPGSWQSSQWTAIRQARRDVVAKYAERVALFDLASHWPMLAKDGSTSEGLMLEEAFPLHLSLKGNERMAQIFSDLLTPAP